MNGQACADDTTQKLRILVVEDDPETLAATVELLVLLGHWATGVNSAEGALDRFSEGVFDVLVLDIHLPALSGLDLAEKLRSRDRLPVIFASGSKAPFEMPEGSIWLSKPYSTGQLESALARATEFIRADETRDHDWPVGPQSVRAVG